MQTAELMARLERHYQPPGNLPGGIFVPECGWNPGGGSRADALYVGFTSTSGRILVGHEVKVSRADWRTELATVGKADRWHDQCHQWYVVAPDVTVVPPEEVPDGWGLLLADGRTRTRLRVAVKARTREALIPSWDAVRSIMARQDTLRATAIAKARQDIDRRLRDEHERRYAERSAKADIPAEYRNAKAMIDQLRERGVDVTASPWAPTEISPEDLAVALQLAKNIRASTNGWQGSITQARAKMADLNQTLGDLERTLKGAGR